MMEHGPYALLGALEWLAANWWVVPAAIGSGVLVGFLLARRGA